MQLSPLTSESGLLAGRYRLQQRLGAGGMGEVYLADDLALEGASVAIKLLYPHLVADHTALSRFRNEVLVARRLIHPAIVRTFNLEIADSRAFIVMEYVAGITLRERLRDRFTDGMPTATLVYFASIIAHGMHHSHQMGIIHRDLKPDNVLIGASDTVKLSDFGLSATLRRQTQLTRAGHLMGTPYYMAPEQFRGESLSVTADVYSFGIMLYELALGQLPFTDASLYGLAQQHEHAPLPAERAGALPPCLWQIIRRATNKSPEDRFQGFDELAEALNELNGVPLPPELKTSYTSTSTEDPPPPTPAARRPTATPRRLVLAYLVFLLLFIQLSRSNFFIRGLAAVPLLRAESWLGFRLNGLRSILAVTVDFTSRSLADELLLGSNTDTVRVLGGDDPNAERNRNSKGEYALHVAASKSDLLSAQVQLGFGADPNLTSHDGRTPLHSAALSHDRAIAEYLLSKGAAPDVVAKNGATPLLIAAQTGDEPMALLLLRAGADPHRIDREGMSAIDYARAQKKGAFLEEVQRR